VPCNVSLQQGLSPAADAICQKPEPAPDSAVFVGRLDWDSGITHYINALDLLRAQHGIDLRLDVYGGGALEHVLRTDVKHRRLPVRFHGFVDEAQSRLADGCFAFVSGRLAIQEAMARRRLVVTTYVNQLKRSYVCDEPFGSYVTVGDSPEAIADIVANYTTDATRRAAMVDRAFEYARTLTWERTARGYLRLWQNGLAAKPAGQSPLTRLQLAMDLADEFK